MDNVESRARSRYLGAVTFTLKLSKAQRKYRTLYDPSVAHSDNRRCGHLVSILEPQLGESGFKILSRNCLPWFLFPQALSPKRPDIDSPLTIHLLARYLTLHKPKNLNKIHKILSDMKPYSHRVYTCQLAQKFMYWAVERETEEYIYIYTFGASKWFFFIFLPENADKQTHTNWRKPGSVLEIRTGTILYEIQRWSLVLEQQ